MTDDPRATPSRPAAGGGRLTQRTTQLVVGLVLYGVSLGLMVRSGLGTAPWDVLHVGVAGLVPLSIGTVVVITSVLVLLAWWPLRERPGPGTVANAVLVGVFVDVTLVVLPEIESLGVRIVLLVAGVLGNGLATGMYIGAGFGRGPRDGLMTGLNRVTGLSLRLVRTGLEVSVVVAGVLLGGPLGVGTVAYALLIGPLSQLTIPWFDHRRARPAGSARASRAVQTQQGARRSRDGRPGSS
ncbi:hypothetical protein KLP28_01485 [Nocardioidaceae bacterium]|nr:hypothetical protein KLP28_01485 [Nocardioidaceae bacterium]